MQWLYDLFAAALAPVNIVYTVLLVLLAVYWVVALLGVIDMGLFDFGGEDAGSSTDFDPTLGKSLWGFLNVGEVPVVAWLTVVILTMWVGSVQLNYYLNNDQMGVAALLFVPLLMTGVFVAKLVTEPFRWLNRHRQREDDLLGHTAVVTSSSVSEAFGEIEISLRGAPVRMNARSTGGEVLERGAEVIIVDRRRETNQLYTYLVTRRPAGN
jgi:hypothetical protein